MEPVSLAHHGSGLFPGRFARDHSGLRLVAQRPIPTAGRRHRFGGVLVSVGAACAVSGISGVAGAVAEVGVDLQELLIDIAQPVIDPGKL